MTITTARPTRRTLVRGAAWSVPVVSIAAAAPAFASSTQGSSGFSGVEGTANKWGTGNDKHVSWDLLLTNGAVAIQSISITFTYVPASGKGFTVFKIYSYSAPLPAVQTPRDTSWSSPTFPTAVNSATSTHAGIAANSTTRIHTDFAGGDNASGTVSAVATIHYVGQPVAVPLTIPAVSWGSGDEHVHPNPPA